MKQSMKLQTSRILRNKGFCGILLCGSLTLCGCVKENLADCPPDAAGSGVELRYRYDLNMHYADRFDPAVGDLKAFVFDAGGVLCDSLAPAVRRGELCAGWMRRIDLDPGVYTILTWAGDAGFTQTFGIGEGEGLSAPVIGRTRLEDLQAALRYTGSGSDAVAPAQADLNDLYYGIADRVEVREGEYNRVLTPLVKNTNTIRVRMAGFGAVARNGEAIPADFDVRLTGRNGRYRFDNLAPSGAQLVEYIPVRASVEKDTVTLELRTVRLMQSGADARTDAALSLCVVYKPTQVAVCDKMDVVGTVLDMRIPARDATGKVLTDEDGQPLMTYPTLEYLDRQDVFDILFKAEKKPGSDELVFTVYINGWKITNIIPVP